METVLNAIADWIKGILAGAIMSNLSGLFDSVNEQVGEIATQVGTSPADFEPRVFEMIRGVSNSAILPIAGVFLTLVACYELVQMVTEHNNLASFEPALITKWIIKTGCAVYLISNTFDIVMGVFDLAQGVIAESSGIVAGNTAVNETGLANLEASLMDDGCGAAVWTVFAVLLHRHHPAYPVHRDFRHRLWTYDRNLYGSQSWHPSRFPPSAAMNRARWARTTCAASLPWASRASSS